MGGFAGPAKLEDGEAVYLGLDLSSTTDLTENGSSGLGFGSLMICW
jgi:hypothetical protein